MIGSSSEVEILTILRKLGIAKLYTLVFQKARKQLEILVMLGCQRNVPLPWRSILSGSFKLSIEPKQDKRIIIV